MRSQYEDGEVIEYRTVVDEGKPEGGWVAFRYTKDGILVDRPPSEDGECLSMRQETQPMEVTVPLNPLAEALGRLLPLAEKWLEKQVGQVEMAPKASAEDFSPLVKEWYTPEEVADLFLLHVQTVMRWCREGKLNAEKVGGNEANGKGGRYRIPREAINAYLHRQRLIHGQRRRSAK
jgi:excisionase family DNA binding protein